MKANPELVERFLAAHADWSRGRLSSSLNPDYQTRNAEPASQSTADEWRTAYAAGRWQKVGGSSVYVEDGKIVRGCPGLKGERVADLIDESDESRARREHRQDVAESKGLRGRHLSISEVRKLETKRGSAAHDDVKKIAAQYDVKPADVLATLDDAHQLVKEQVAQREEMRQRARKLSGLTAGDLSRLENSHRDSSSIPGLDTVGRSLSMEYPEFGNEDEEDLAAKVWDLIREGAQDVPAKHSPEVIEQAAQIVASTGGARRRGGGGGKYRPPAKATAARHHDDDFNFGANIEDSDRFSMRFEEAVGIVWRALQRQRSVA